LRDSKNERIDRINRMHGIGKKTLTAKRVYRRKRSKRREKKCRLGINEPRIEDSRGGISE